jgi:threonine synthase
MAVVSRLRCPKCDYEPPSRITFQCAQCRSILEVHTDISHLSRSDFEAMRQSRDQSIWRWFDFFPVQSPSSIVSLGEENTPLIYASRLGAWLGIPNLYLKNDTVLPTGSLKDPSSSVGLSVAKELGFTTATVMSTGNAAASVAAYSAAAGIKSVVMVLLGTAASKLCKRARTARWSSSSMAISISKWRSCTKPRCKNSASTIAFHRIRIVTKAKNRMLTNSSISSMEEFQIG